MKLHAKGVVIAALVALLAGAMPLLPAGMAAQQDDNVRIIRSVAAREGIPPQVLLAIARREDARLDPAALGDVGSRWGPSVGVFQIQYRLHGLTAAQCRGVEFSARWTCRRITSWNRGLWYGVGRHNGDGEAARRYIADIRRRAGQIETGSGGNAADVSRAKNPPARK